MQFRHVGGFFFGFPLMHQQEVGFPGDQLVVHRSPDAAFFAFRLAAHRGGQTWQGVRKRWRMVQRDHADFLQGAAFREAAQQPQFSFCGLSEPGKDMA